MAIVEFEGSQLQKDLQKGGVTPLDQKYLDSQLRKDVEAGQAAQKTTTSRSRTSYYSPPPKTPAPSPEPEVSQPAQPPLIVQPAQPPSLPERLKTIPGYVSQTIKADGIYPAAVGAGQIIRGDVKTKRAIQEQKERESLRDFKRELLPYEARGTASTEFTEDYKVKAQPTVQDIETKASLGEISKKVAVEEISKIKSGQAQERIDQEFQSRVQPEIEVIQRQSQQEIETYRAELIGRQDLTVEQKNKLLEQRASEVSKRAEEQVQERVKTFNKEVGEQIRQQTEREVRDAERRINIQQNIKKGIIYGGIGAGAGLVAAPIVAATIPAKAIPAISKVSSGAFAVGTTATTAYAGVGVAEDWRRGELTGLSVASRLSNVAPMVSFYVGAKAGAKLVSPKVDFKQLETAAKTAKLKPIGKPKGITKESDLRTLKLTSEGKVETDKYFQQGFTLRKQSYELYNPTRTLNKVLDKGFPFRKIEFVEVVDVKGKVIYRTATGTINLGGGRYTYKERFIQDSVGIRDESGTIRMDTYTTRAVGPTRKPVITQRATEELIKTQVDYYKLPSGEIQRIVKGKTAVAELGKTYPEQIFKSAELQKVTRIKYGKEDFILEQTPAFVAKKPLLAGLEVTYQPLAAAGVGGRVLPPVDSVKIPKPFTPPKVQDVTDVTGISQGLKTIQVSETILAPPTDYSQQIMQSLKTAKFTTIPQTPLPITTLQPSQALKSASELEKEFSIDVGKLSLSVQPIIKEKDPPDITIPPIVRTAQPPRITERQIQAQAQVITPATLLKLEQETTPTTSTALKTIPITPIPIPRIKPFDLPPIFPPLKQREWSPQKMGRALKTRTPRTPAYTASLAAAAVQAQPLKITKKQYEKLKKRVYTGLETRPVIQIKEDKELSKQIKKAVQF